ncbi:protachykinin-1 [Tachyglossus aculeatus]|uniref:protachykinin-1 n=1 Tax=Tachyglossus aculeatus TaxID=9261 RepID=UPI0018F2F28D|nr:protachykinin-1 [Tachyglossus aculeatus]XP_038596773.1 protachykinin-1 [Tachyglossus aculeatus]
MNLIAVVAVLFLMSARGSAADELGGSDDPGYWGDWAEPDQAKEELPDVFEHFLQRMARRPKPQQFFGLMGKRDAGPGQIAHKRHKAESFVGLMGKRSLNLGSFDRTVAQSYERRRK